MRKADRQKAIAEQVKYLIATGEHANYVSVDIALNVGGVSAEDVSDFMARPGVRTSIDRRCEAVQRTRASVKSGQV